MRSITHRDGVGLMLVDESADDILRARHRSVTLHKVDERVRSEFSRVVDHDDLAPSALARIDAENDASAERSREEQPSKILRKNAHRVAIGGELEGDADVGLDRGTQEATHCIFDR